MLFRIILLIVAILINFRLTAQEVNLNILDSNTKKLITDVQIVGFTKDTTEIFSIYTIEKITSLDINRLDYIYLSHLNYDNKFISIDELSSNKQPVNIFLLPNNLFSDEVTVSSSKFKDRQKRTSLNVYQLNAKKLNSINSNTSVDLLERAENVYIQKSQMGGGSPVLRGFEANKILLSLDGVKMNNAIYRGGHLQNALSIGHLFLDNVEVITGPGSLVYGSDALGGVISFQTFNPEENYKQLKFSSSISFPNDAISIGVIQHNYKQRFGYSIGFNYSAFGKYNVGKWRPNNENRWGYLPNYVVSSNGSDTIINNKKPYQLPENYTGYNQIDLLGKLNWNLKPGNRSFILSTNISLANNIPRFDRLNDVLEDGSLKYSKWEYGKQHRSLVSLQYKSSRKNRLYSEHKAILAFQNIKESRISRRLNNPTEKEQLETVNIFSAATDFLKEFKNKNLEVQYGVEWILNLVSSEAYNTNTWDTNEERTITTSRYPNGSNFTQSTDVYTLIRKRLNNKTNLNFGLRISGYQLKISYDSIPFYDLQLKNKTTNFGGTYSIGVKHQLSEKSNIKLNISSGFRAPNIDDVGKIFNPAPQVLVIPNTDVKPEYVYNFDISLKQQIATFANISVGGYYTIARNLIRRSPTQLSGLDSINYENETFAIYSNTNVGKARLAGLFATIKAYDKSGKFSTSNNIHYSYGRDINQEVPLGHIPPLYGKSDFTYQNKTWGLQTWVLWNAAKKLKYYSPFSEDKLDEALPNGTPAWATLNFQIIKSFEIDKKFNAKMNISASIENLMDLHYKPFSSGIAAAGRNIKLKLTAEF